MTPAQMQERIAELEEENAYLRGELGLTDTSAQRAILRRAGLTGAMAALMTALHCANGRTLSVLQILDAMGTTAEPKIVAVQVSKLRAKWGREVIETVWGCGYRITPAGVAKYEAALGFATVLAA